MWICNFIVGIARLSICWSVSPLVCLLVCPWWSSRKMSFFMLPIWYCVLLVSHLFSSFTYWLSETGSIFEITWQGQIYFNMLWTFDGSFLWEFTFCVFGCVKQARAILHFLWQYNTLYNFSNYWANTIQYQYNTIS